MSGADISAGQRDRIKRQDIAFQIAVWRAHGLVPASVQHIQWKKEMAASRDILNVASDDFPEMPTSEHAVMSNSKAIILQVCEKHRVTYGEITGEQRSRPIVYARHEACYRLSRETRMSLTQIGHRFDRDHTTVLAGIRRHKQRMVEEFVAA